ncbi:MAG: hypothetical protein AAF378_08270 [Cyanobacteria bacterium P01_A01_bin.84]
MSKYDWNRFLKFQRRVHNLQVAKAQAKLRKEKPKSRIPALLNQLKIKDSDTAQLVQNKVTSFWLTFGFGKSQAEAIASIPINWVLQPGNNIPQLAIIFRAPEKPRSGNYTIHIPHYTGARPLSIAGYTKGPYGVILELKDNSKITIYGNSHESAEGYIKKNLLKYVSSRYKTSSFKRVTRKNVQVNKMVPYRADYFPLGSEQGAIPKWRHYF